MIFRLSRLVGYVILSPGKATIGCNSPPRLPNRDSEGPFPKARNLENRAPRLHREFRKSGKKTYCLDMNLMINHVPEKCFLGKKYITGS